MYNRILIPVDGSAASSRACTEAIKLAVDQKARIRLLCVVSYSYLSAVLGGAVTGDLLRRVRADAQASLDAAQAEARKAELEVEAGVLEHHGTQIGEAIVEYAKKWNAELIVMGTHGRRGFARATLGSDATYVAMHAPTPVLLVRGTSV